MAANVEIAYSREHTCVLNKLVYSARRAFTCAYQETESIEERSLHTVTVCNSNESMKTKPQVSTVKLFKTSCNSY